MNLLIHTEYRNALLLDENLKKIVGVRYNEVSDKLISREVVLVQLNDEFKYTSCVSGDAVNAPAGSVVCLTYDGIMAIDEVTAYLSERRKEHESNALKACAFSNGDCEVTCSDCN